MFTDVYLTTTNPRLSLNELFRINVLISVIFHTVLYTAFFNLASYIFLGKSLSTIVNIRLVVSLLIIMIVGFFARFLHVKEIYRAYNYDMTKTRAHLDKLYISWIFIS